MNGQITVEKSQREAGGQVWHWLTGDTYPHRELLKQHGARWSKKRQAWYLIGAEIPAAIRALITSDAQPYQPNRDSSSPLLAIFGGLIVGKERAANGDLIVRGESGVFATRTTWIDHHEERKPVWLFDLAPQDRVGSSVSAIQKALQINGALYSLYTRKWHFDQPDKVDALDKLVEQVATSDQPADSRSAVPAMTPELARMIEQTLADDDAQAQAERDAAVPVDQPPAIAKLTEGIRILKPPPMPAEGEPLDAVQSAIRTVRAQPIATMQGAALATGRTARIAQTFVGELTGSITGQVFCYGYAVHEGICIYVNMAGPRMGVEAIRAKLSKGDQVSVVPLDAPSLELTAGEGNSGMYHAYLHYLPEARFASLILVHDWAVTPNYGGKATTFIFRTSDAQATAKLRHHIMQLVNIPVFEAWSAYLYEAGQRAMLVRKTRSAGGVDLLSVDLDADAWTRLLTGGLEQRTIRLPQGTV
jgi:hypothetical protein